MKRIGLFLLTNIAVLVVLSITLRLFGFEGFLAQNGVDLNLASTLMFAAIFGFGGAFISLAMSKFIAKKSMGVHVIEQPQNESERWLLQRVESHARQAGIAMPEVGIYGGMELNAFATGMNKNKALVAVSQGLLTNMRQNEVDAVLGHEIAHVANGDMVTLALIQGVVNTFVIFLSRVIGHFIDRAVFKTEQGHGPAFWITTIVAEIFLGILASIIVMWFSRQREYRADAGGASLAGRQNMIDALQRLNQARVPSQLPEQLQAFGINGGLAQGFKKLFMTHPPIQERIQRLKNNM